MHIYIHTYINIQTDTERDREVKIKYIYFLIQILTGLPIVKITFQFENWNSLFNEL